MLEQAPFEVFDPAQPDQRGGDQRPRSKACAALDRKRRRWHQGNRLNDAEPKLAGYPGISGRMSSERVAGYSGMRIFGGVARISVFYVFEIGRMSAEE